MKEPKFGKWTHVNERLPGRHDQVLAADPKTHDQFMVTGGELAARSELLLWMPLPSPDSIENYFKPFSAP
jgi:hypothetical protein